MQVDLLPRQLLKSFSEDDASETYVASITPLPSILVFPLL